MGSNFVLSIIAMSMAAWVLTTWIRARHGYPVTDDWGATVSKDGAAAPDAARQIELLLAENARLTERLLRLEERLSVVERIVTDRADRLSAEIASLR